MTDKEKALKALKYYPKILKYPISLQSKAGYMAAAAMVDDSLGLDHLRAVDAVELFINVLLEKGDSQYER